jgi:uncharacterized membrane protein
MNAKMLRDKRGYSTLFWATFFGLVLIPMLALSIEVGRFFFSRSQIAAAADAAALASAIEINQRLFVETGQLAPNSQTYAWAQKAANANSSELLDKGVYPRVSNIVISGNTVKVAVSAQLELLFPSIVPDVTVTEWGKAEVRALR